MLKKIYLVWAIFWVLIGFLITMPINLIFLSFKKTYPIAHFLRKVWAWFIFIPNGMILKVNGKENLKGLEKWIYTPNHSSYIDIPTTALALPGVLCFMAKSELAKVPVFGYFFKTIDISVNRGSSVNAYNAFLEAGNRLENGHQIPVIFPEGTIPKNAPHLGKFKIGAFKLAIEKKVPIVPVTMIDNCKRFPDKKPIIATPGKLRVFIHRPIPTENLKAEDAPKLMEEVYCIIENKLKEYYPI